jgi:hypothetical protein
MDRQIASTSSEVTSVMEERTGLEAISRDISNEVCEIADKLPFCILVDSEKCYEKFNATGRRMVIRFKCQGEHQDPYTYLDECVSELTKFVVNEIPGRDLVGMRIRNIENVCDKVVCISFRPCDQFSYNLVWEALGKVVQSNAVFGLTDRLEVCFDHVRMPLGKGRVRTKGRSLDVMGAVKRSIVVVRGTSLCLAHALVIAMAQANGDPEYKAYRNGNRLEKPVKELLRSSGVDLSQGGGIEELRQFQEFLSGFKIVVYDGLSPERVIFTGNSISEKKLSLLFDEETGHYNVITNIKAAMGKKFICEACDTMYDKTHKCKYACSLCTVSPPCSKGTERYCDACNRTFVSDTCFQNHVTLKVQNKLVCQWKRACRSCCAIVSGARLVNVSNRFAPCAIDINLQDIYVT